LAIRTNDLACELFKNESSLTYLRIQELTGTLLKEQRHYAEEAIRITEFDFENESKLNKILKGKWEGTKKGKKMYGATGKGNQRMLNYEGVKSSKEVVDDFLKIAESYNKKKGKSK
jgi:hypothetical protein